MVKIMALDRWAISHAPTVVDDEADAGGTVFGVE
jgi:hypothetical protein